MAIDTRPARLSMLRQQVDRLELWERDAVADAFEVADQFVEALDTIQRGRYQPERATEETTAARQTCVSGLGDVFAAIDVATARERSRVGDIFDGDARTRATAGRQLRDLVDVNRLTIADSAQDVRGVVETADGFGFGTEARAIALRVVREKAADEQRRYRQGGAWFSLLCWLTEAATTPTARHEIGRRVDGRRDALRQIVKEVANVLGVHNELTRTAQAQTQPPAPMPDVKPSTYVVGRFFDLNPQFRR